MSATLETADVVTQLVQLAQGVNEERRGVGREPFFHPVLLSIDGEISPISAFTRDISSSGVGLLHHQPIKARPLTLVTYLDDDQRVELRVGISWCLRCGEGFYISGGSFI
jgi:hypothetical protein